VYRAGNVSAVFSGGRCPFATLLWNDGEAMPAPFTPESLPFLSIEEIARLFRSRRLSPVELTTLLLERIERINPRLNAYLTVAADRALAEARRAEAELCSPRGRKSRRDRGLLHGIPLSLKDNIYSEGIRTTGGSRILRDFVPLHDAHVVQLLKIAGAVILGKTNMHEFAYGVTTNNPHYGPARNPWDTARIPGGSSGGSAAAVAAGLCCASIGTDTGGSIRIPAALCGVTGIKPTYSRVSVEGIIPLSLTLDCAGPIARTAGDAAIVLDAICAHLPGESRFAAAAKRSSRAGKFRLGLLREFPAERVAPEILSVFENALASLRKQGVTMKNISVPLWADSEDAGNEIAWPEATHYHQQSGWYPAHADEYGEDVRTRLEMGTRVPATVYLKALETREKFIQQLHLALEDGKFDAIVVPTTPIAAPLVGEETTRLAEKDLPTRALLLGPNRPANLAGVPAISVPCGFTSSGLPAGLQLIGAAGDEALLLRIAAVVERAQPVTRRPPLV